MVASPFLIYLIGRKISYINALCKHDSFYSFSDEEVKVRVNRRHFWQGTFLEIRHARRKLKRKTLCMFCTFEFGESKLELQFHRGFESLDITYLLHFFTYSKFSLEKMGSTPQKTKSTKCNFNTRIMPIVVLAGLK